MTVTSWNTQHDSRKLEHTTWQPQAGTHNMTATNWNTQHDSHKLEHTTWQSQAGTHNMTVTSWNTQHDSRKLEHTTWQSQAGTHNMTVTSWNTQHDSHKLEHTTWQSQAGTHNMTATSWNTQHDSHKLEHTTWQSQAGTHNMTVASWNAQHDSHKLEHTTWQSQAGTHNMTVLVTLVCRHTMHLSQNTTVRTLFPDNPSVQLQTLTSVCTLKVPPLFDTQKYCMLLCLTRVRWSKFPAKDYKAPPSPPPPNFFSGTCISCVHMHTYWPDTMASLSPSRFSLMRINSCRRLRATSVFWFTNTLTASFKDTAARSWTWKTSRCYNKQNKKR